MFPHNKSSGNTSQEHKWMPETADSAEPYNFCAFFYTYIPIKKFNL